MKFGTIGKRFSKGLAGLALAMATASLFPGFAQATTPVTFHYDSGGFTSSPRGQSPRFGTHLTADITFSKDFDYTIRPLQHLNSIATLLDWSVTSGEFTLNSKNATFSSDITDYFSTFFTVPLVQIRFSAIGHVGGVPVSISGDPSINITDGIGVNPAIRCGPYLVICGTNFRNFNLGGGSFTKSFDYKGGGGGGGGHGAVPEPASWALMIGGFGLTGVALRRRRAAAAAV